MEPTNYIRFVKRTVHSSHDTTPRTRFILQQKWTEIGDKVFGRLHPLKEEWRDVETVEEEA